MENHKKGKYKRNAQTEKYKTFKGNKSEGQGFADRRKKKIHYEYLKMLKKEKKKNNMIPVINYNEEEIPGNSTKDLQKPNEEENMNTYSVSQKQFSKKKLQKDKQRKEMLKKKQEMNEALSQYKNKKSKQYKMLCKKTYKGQPVMRNRMELLLHKIQSGMDQT